MFARYPDMAEKVPYEQYDEKIANNKVEKAKKIFKALKKKYSFVIKNKDDKTNNGIKNGKR